MGAQVFDSELKQKVDPVVDLFRNGLQKTMITGAQNTAEVAKESGSGKLIRNSENLEEATKNFVAVLNSLMDCVDRYTTMIAKHEEALN